MRLAVTHRGNSQRTCLVPAPIHAESFGLGIRITGFWSVNQMEIIQKTGTCFVPVLLEPVFSFPLFSCIESGRYHSHGRDIRRYIHRHTQLIGSDENDTLRFLNNNVQLSGSIDDGSGTNAFKYSNTTKPIFVNLGTGQATGVTSRIYTGVVANIHDILTGPGNDYLLAAR